MKSSILKSAIFAIVVLACTISHAQIRIGIKGGYNLSTLHFDKDIVSSDKQQGFFIGPTIDMNIPKTGIGCDVSFLFDHKNISMQTETEDHTKSLSYASIPINFKLSTGLKSILSAYIATGPEFSWYLGKTQIWENRYRLNESELSWNFGAGITLIKDFRIGYNYNIGIGKHNELELESLPDAIIKSHQCTHKVAITVFL